MSDITDILADAERLERERTQGEWIAENVEALADGSEGCGWGVVAGHGIIVMHDFVRPADAAFIAFCGTHMGTLLSLLQAHEARVGELEHDLTMAKEVITSLVKLRADEIQRAEQAEAEVAQLKKDYWTVNQSWAESRERHLQAEAEVARLRAQLTRLRDVATTCVAKLDECGPHIAAAFQMQQIHGFPYTGPRYDIGLTALRKELEAQR